MKEIWKDIKGYEGLYQVSNLGRVKSLERIILDSFCTRQFKGKILSPTQHNGKQPYYYVTLSKEHKSHKEFIHRLVAITFINNPKNLRQVNHKNGNTHDNNVNNLEWVTNRDNTIHAYDNYLRNKKVIWIADGEKYISLMGLCKQLNLNYKKVFSRIKYGKWDLERAIDYKGGGAYVISKIIPTPRKCIE